MYMYINIDYNHKTNVIQPIKPYQVNTFYCGTQLVTYSVLRTQKQVRGFKNSNPRNISNIAYLAGKFCEA